VIRQTLDDFQWKLHTISSIQRTAGSRWPWSLQTADTTATTEDTVTVNLQILFLFCRVFIPVSTGKNAPKIN